MAYSPYQSDRRYKSRRWLLIALVLTVVIVVVGFLASRQTNQRGTVEFFGASQEAATLNEEAAQTFGQALASIGVITRQDLTHRLDTVLEKSSEAEELVDAVSSVPFDIGASYGTMSTASSSWMAGSEEVTRVIVGIMDGEIVETAVPELQRALNELSVGDVAYEQYRTSLVVIPEAVEGLEFPPIQYIDSQSDDPLRFNATNLVLRIQAAYALLPHHDIAIAGSTLPGVVGDRDGTPVVPFADTISITALVTNDGNETEEGIEIALSVLDVNSGEVVTRSDVVGELTGGNSTTVTFADLEIEPGGLYQAVLQATISVDIKPENNEWTLNFIWNAES